MAQYHVEQTHSGSHSTNAEVIYTVHNERGPIPALRYSVEQEAENVCTALNEFKQLQAYLTYKHNGITHSAVIYNVLAPAVDILYYHVSEHLSGTTSLSDDHNAHKAQALREAGYSDPAVLWKAIE